MRPAGRSDGSNNLRTELFLAAFRFSCIKSNYFNVSLGLLLYRYHSVDLHGAATVLNVVVLKEETLSPEYEKSSQETNH